MSLLGPIWAFSTSCGRCSGGACSRVAARSFPHSPILVSVRRPCDGPGPHSRMGAGASRSSWQRVVQDDSQWQAHRHGGYRPVACDLVGFWRPRLQGCPTKHYCAPAGKALPAIPLGLTARVGSVGSQRLAIPCLLVRPEAEEPGEPALQRRLLQQTQALLAADAVLVTDRGFPLAQLQAAGITRYVSRGPTNFTARRATPLVGVQSSMILPPPFPASSTTPDHSGGTACLDTNVPYRITPGYCWSSSLH
jgi:hypothetical protein